MAKEKVASLTFIGRPFPNSMMDEHRSFNKTNMQMENDEEFRDFLTKNGFENNRSTMIAFGPENFMYWYGVLTDKEVAVPKGMMKYVLPEGEIAVEESAGDLSNFSLPQNYIVPTFFDKLEKEGIKVYENPGDSDTPFFVQDLDLKNKKLRQIWYLDGE